MSFAGALASLALLSAAVRHNRLAYHADKAQGGSSPGNNNNRPRWLRLSGNLSRTLVALAVEGITDPKELRRKAIENMILTDHQAR